LHQIFRNKNSKREFIQGNLNDKENSDPIPDNSIPRIEFLERGFKGSFLYIGEEGTAKFNFDMDRADCIAHIEIPSNAEWVQKTNIDLNFRQGILVYVAKEFYLKELDTTCVTEILDDRIIFLSPPKPKILSSAEIVLILGFGLVIAGIVMLITGTSLGILRVYSRAQTNYELDGIVVIFFGLVMLLTQIKRLAKNKKNRSL
jgi:hypothetical protein